ncbi:ketopantoate reductase PanE/ApbA C terminal-domain-containing protein [Xylariales sp. PMI_506]|nr:ketopantoate reductase PanE/ApbA C terminal-domain-containing protein [Xylariales sp. PMI_506]
MATKTASAIAPATNRPERVPAKWLQDIIQDDRKPQRLYAWTSDNLDIKHGPMKPVSETTKAQGSTPSQHNGRIYILGIGNLGRLFASGLHKLPNKPPITLVVHRKALLERWVSSPGIEITRQGKLERTADFDLEWWTDERPERGDVQEPAAGSVIGNLIIATKAADALSQVDRLRKYLNQDSTVAFVQNGMCKLWPPLGDIYTSHRFNKGQEPNWVACVTTHGVISTGPFSSLHASPASVSIGPVSLNPKSRADPYYLGRQLARAPDLSGQIVPKRDLWILQLEKLVVNSVINPLTAILDCKNGEIFTDRGDYLPEIVDRLIKEASDVLRALVLSPSNADILNETGGGDTVVFQTLDNPTKATTQESLVERFSFGNLRAMVYDVGHKVRENTSSMLQDIRAGKKTEIRDFNGWLVDSAKLLDLNLRLSTHERLISLVEDSATVSRSELGPLFNLTSCH